ncbi:hypothetical protein K7H09_19335 [Halomonas sp. IOP_14]|uniref:hypothetical protein n=1 Tax=Halomonas sp. IOP_14 TaxID=2873295 RepID=UPI001E605646|nr:hypothetical protein [Halomonas sp. IOP_14]MCD1588159.1 hypothetical protein [Halomonas sp. IOP_14]
MSRTIAVQNADGFDDYVVAEIRPVHHRPSSGKDADFASTVSFYLSTGQVLNHVSAERFENPMTEESYYAVNDEDIEWLLSLQPIGSGTNGG